MKTVADALSERMRETEMQLHLLAAQRVSNLLQQKGLRRDEVLALIEWQRDELSLAEDLRQQICGGEP